MRYVVNGLSDEGQYLSDLAIMYVSLLFRVHSISLPINEAAVQPVSVANNVAGENQS